MYLTQDQAFLWMQNSYLTKLNEHENNKLSTQLCFFTNILIDCSENIFFVYNHKVATIPVQKFGRTEKVIILVKNWKNHNCITLQSCRICRNWHSIFDMSIFDIVELFDNLPNLSASQNLLSLSRAHMRFSSIFHVSFYEILRLKEYEIIQL